MRRFKLASDVIALALILLVGLPPAAWSAEPVEKTVRLVVDYGDGVQVHFNSLPWREGMTALDALSAASTHRHGIPFAHKGSLSTAMVTKIGDLKNEGDGRNWLYSVNDKQGEVSAGIHKLKSNDAVLWKFEVYRYNR
jgi:Domain of unknown function (DUF4430)